MNGCGGNAGEERLDTARKIDLIVGLLDGVGVGQAVDEFQRANSCLYGVWCRNRGRHLRGKLRLTFLRLRLHTK
jgi:hypothetical protein